MNRLDTVEKTYQKNQDLALRAGDQVRVHTKIKEGDRERIQVFEGFVVRIHGCGTRKNLTVRKVSYGVGVERIFPIHSPNVAQIEFMSRGKVRQSRIYYMRERFGKKARMERDIRVSRDHVMVDEAAEPSSENAETSAE